MADSDSATTPVSGDRATSGRNLAGAAAHGVAVTMVVQGLRIVLQFGSVIVMARLLAPEAFGLLAMVTAVIGVANLIRDFGLSMASIQAKDLGTAERTNLFWVNTALGTACAVAGIAATPLLVALYDEPRLEEIVAPLAAVFVLSGLNTQYRADLTRRLRFVAIGVSDLGGPLVGIAVAIVLALGGAGVWALVAQQVVTAFVSLVVNVVSGGWWPGWYRRSVSIRRFFRFGGGVLGAQLLSYVTQNVDNVAIGAYAGPIQLGLYSRAYQLLMVPLNQINAPLTNVALPVLSRVQEDRDALGRALRRAQFVATYVTSTVLVVAAALAEPLVAILLGPQWSGVTVMFTVLALGGVFRSVSQLAYWAHLATAHTGAFLKLQLWTQPVMVLLVVGGVPWGGVGVAVGHLVANLLYWVVALLAVARTTGVAVGPLFRDALTTLGAVALPAGLAAGAVARLVGGPWLQVGAGLLAAAAAVGLVGALTPTVRGDVRAAVQTFRTLRRR